MDFLLLLEGSASAGLRKLGWGDARGTQEQVGISLEGPALLPLRLPFQHPRWRSPLGAGLQAHMPSAEPQGQAWEGDEPRAGGSVPGTRCSPGPLLPDPLGPALTVRVETRWSDLCWGLSRSPSPSPAHSRAGACGASGHLPLLASVSAAPAGDVFRAHRRSCSSAAPASVQLRGRFILQHGSQSWCCGHFRPGDS